MRASRPHSAFTLLELLTAMALMSALTVSLYTSLRVAFKARDGAAQALAPTRAAVAALDLLAADLASALAPVSTLSGEFNGQDAKGEGGRDADTLVFRACSHVTGDSEIAGDVQRVEWALVTQPNEPDGALVRRVSTNLLAPELVTPPDEVLCRRVLSFNLRYFDGTLWQDTWDSTTHGNALPNAVELSIEVARPGAAASADSAVPATESLKLTRILPLPCARPTTVDETRLLTDLSE